MENKNKLNKSGGSQAPSETDSKANMPTDPDEKKETAQEGDIRKVEREHSQKESFGDNYEVEQENKMGEEEAKSEKGNRTGRR
jgi:hypothetical protein